ncbi:MAG: toll/interleukin-1 receptor domain-containing protein [Lachnospiraceae bacterium]|nr:toll/interleukin-1 receptor domain-containing protein [Lachnospiraceae bacterium]
MKVFVSWSGDFSRKIAETLKKWIPCIVQSVDVFFSPEDIEKGNNWEKILSSELAECKFGIICLTSENTNAPWLNFEAGAIAKTLDSKVAALMINIKPSDIRGPLSLYQATKLEKDDFYQLIESINKTLDEPREDKVLKNAFDAMWPHLIEEINGVIEEFTIKNKKKENSNISEQNESSPIEEILQLLRKQNSILANPENLLPVEYIERIQNRISERKQDLYLEDDRIGKELLRYCRFLISNMRRYSGNENMLELIKNMHIEELLNIVEQFGRGKNKRGFWLEIRELEMELRKCMMQGYVEV